jgi:hypothetical protein
MNEKYWNNNNNNNNNNKINNNIIEVVYEDLQRNLSNSLNVNIYIINIYNIYYI